jgi:hypothetical protein
MWLQYPGRRTSKQTTLKLANVTVDNHARSGNFILLARTRARFGLPPRVESYQLLEIDGRRDSRHRTLGGAVAFAQGNGWTIHQKCAGRRVDSNACELDDQLWREVEQLLHAELLKVSVPAPSALPGNQ